MRTRSYAQRVDELIRRARAQVGYRSRIQKVNIFGQQVGHDGQAWSGIFLETLFRDAGERGLPSMISTTSALATFVKRNQLHSKPKLGDIVFYGFSTDHAFAQPHVGIVSEVKNFRKLGEFKAIEGQVSSGLAKGPQESDGVYERKRYATEVLAFVRPKYGVGVPIGQAVGKGVPYIRPPQVQPGKSTKATIYLQQALGDAVGLQGAIRGKYDEPTQAAVAAYQRRIGFVGNEANGVANEATLRRLALETKFSRFRVTGLDESPAGA